MNVVSSLTDAVVDVIPSIKCRQESLTLISLSMSCIQLNAAVDGHIAIFSHRRELARLYAKACASEKTYQQSIAPMLREAADALEIRVNVSEKTLNDILDKLILFQQSISQYQEQNRALSTELSRNGLANLANTKLFIADKERDICAYIQNILTLASIPLNMNEEVDISADDTLDVLDTRDRSSSASSSPVAPAEAASSSIAAASSSSAAALTRPAHQLNNKECDERQVAKRQKCNNTNNDTSGNILPAMCVVDRNIISTASAVSGVAVESATPTGIHFTSASVGGYGCAVASSLDDNGSIMMQNIKEATDTHVKDSSEEMSSQHVASTGSSDAVSGSTTYCDQSHSHSNIILNQENMSQNEYSEQDSAAVNVGDSLQTENHSSVRNSSSPPTSLSPKAARNITNDNITNYNPGSVNRLSFASQDINSSTQPSVELDVMKGTSYAFMAASASGADSTQHSCLDESV